MPYGRPWLQLCILPSETRLTTESCNLAGEAIASKSDPKKPAGSPGDAVEMGALIPPTRCLLKWLDTDP